ncbi:MAG TPA: hypothetical protein VGS07_17330 [Thermoanaerobaculia bacterium]|jgi:hypothetical protein|nr:hypothetical protein [Thermoanaerobaculia bacterium]
MTMKKLLRKATLRALTVELAEVKGGTDSTLPPPPPPETDAGAHIIDVG